MSKLDEILDGIGTHDYHSDKDMVQAEANISHSKQQIKELFDKLCFEAEVELDVDLLWLRKKVDEL